MGRLIPQVCVDDPQRIVFFFKYKKRHIRVHLVLNGAIDGDRTRDPQSHNLLLYQLSYNRHLLFIARNIIHKSIKNSREIKKSLNYKSRLSKRLLTLKYNIFLLTNNITSTHIKPHIKLSIIFSVICFIVFLFLFM